MVALSLLLTGAFTQTNWREIPGLPAVGSYDGGIGFTRYRANYLDYSPDGKLLAVATNNREVLLFRVSKKPISMAMLRTTGAVVKKVKFSPNGRFMAVLCGGVHARNLGSHLYISKYPFRSLKELGASRQTKDGVPYTAAVSDFAFSRDSDSLLVQQDFFYPVDVGWAYGYSGFEKRSAPNFEKAKWALDVPPKFAPKVTSLDYLFEDSLSWISNDRFLFTTGVPGGCEVHMKDSWCGSPSLGKFDFAAVSPNGRILATASGWMIRTFDLRTGDLLSYGILAPKEVVNYERTHKVPPERRPAGDPGFRASTDMCFSPDSSLIVVFSQFFGYVGCAPRNLKRVAPLLGQTTGGPYSVAISRHTIAVGDSQDIRFTGAKLLAFFEP